eukprot:CAMPEP_0198264762 /NCGR_PEP_ID=MMETSP1447-20131203/17356_1 /TAXON_ID=420782 /ORGANISM="Chaetoceros dichaeta, Strain CCMP1751" /LENGTH=174 /DNA_ID=CAMNT_0043953831 /DNA_START=52 /DNA_END=576 /DNA_ORIENTATION=+
MTIISSLLLLLLTYGASTKQYSHAFLPSHNPIQRSTTIDTQQQLQMGLFDGIMKAFENDEYGPPPDALKATARHILVKTPQEASMILNKLSSSSGDGDDAYSTFTELAQEYSTCPSGAGGGSLGSFGPGTMVPEFDAAIFSPDAVIGSVIGPVETDFGYHIIVVDKRTGGGDWY